MHTITTGFRIASLREASGTTVWRDTPSRPSSREVFMTYARAARALPPFALLLLAAAACPQTAQAQQDPAALTVELGDVSLTKLPFIMAADYGIYEKNNLKIRQYITP